MPATTTPMRRPTTARARTTRTTAACAAETALQKGLATVTKTSLIVLESAVVQALLMDVVPALTEAGGLVSLFIDPDCDQIDVARAVGAPFVELHTGSYANQTGAAQEAELERLKRAAAHAQKIGLKVNAGHGLDYRNTTPIAAMEGVLELNIGFALVSDALTIGVDAAVRAMKSAILEADA